LLQERLAAIGVYQVDLARSAPILTLPTIDLLDPLSWSALIVPLAAHYARASRFANQTHGEGTGSEEADVGIWSAVVAARLLGEPVYATYASRAMLTRLSGGSLPDLSLLYQVSAPYSRPMEPATDQTLSGYYARILEYLATQGSGWGRTEVDSLDVDLARWGELEESMGMEVPASRLPDADTIESLFANLCDGRPINAYPPQLPDGFDEQLMAGDQATSFYALLEHADERPCSLATILAVGWRYKVRRSYALCRELMSGPGQWRQCLDLLATHVLERCALLQQSIEAAYVQQVFARWRDE
jgi:hypothetical protein